MRFVCDSCRAQYMISDDKVGPKGVKVRCKKCGYVIFVRRPEAIPQPAPDAHFDPHAENDGPASAGSEDEEPTSPGYASSSRAGGKGILDDVAEDEIGAVFDQVLSSSGSAVAQNLQGAANPSPAADHDQELTREADTSVLEQLLRQSEETSHPSMTEDASAGDAAKDQNGASYEWFVAIDEKQVGPLAFEKLKDLWDRGEIGPDSLCWRAGLPDWITLSEVPELTSLLAPKPVKPVIVTPAPVVSPSAVASGPVASAFSAGVAVKSGGVQAATGMQTSAEEAGAWKPTAASALASLMKEEIDALAKPAPAPKQVDEVAPSPAALLDVPAAHSNGRHTSSPSMRAYRDDGALRSGAGALGAQNQSLYGYAATTTSSRRGLVIGLAIGGGFLLLALAVVTTILVLRSGSGEPAPVAQPSKSKAPGAQNPPAVASPDREKGAQGGAQGQSGSPGQGGPSSQSAGGQQAQAVTPPSGKPGDSAGAKTEGSGAPSKTEASASQAKVEVSGGSRSERTGSRRERSHTGRVGSNEEITVPRKVDRPEVVARSAQPEDDFDREFGSEEKKRTSVPKAEQPKKSNTVYVPPAPGSEIPDSLGTGDIMQVVVQNKASILKCAAEQKKRDGSLSGKIVMRWTILTNGKTTNIACASDEFKSSYMAQCVAGLIKSWQFPRHRTQGEPINFPFTF